MAKKEHKDHVRDLLATAIVHKALDMEVWIRMYFGRFGGLKFYTFIFRPNQEQP
jgi:hypothetical protein